MIKKVARILLCLLSFTIDIGCSKSSQDMEVVENIDFNGALNVLSLNTWQEGTSVSGGFDAIADIILQTNADVVLLSEIRNYNGTIFSERITEKLRIRGLDFYGYNSNKSALIISKYPIISVAATQSSALTKCTIDLGNNTKVAVYAAHLDYTHYACYLPRGYSGITWQKLPEPILDLTQILEQNLASQRDEAIAVFIKSALAEKDKGNIVIFGGDFNEPSHLDWVESTKHLFDHNGVVVPWHNSISLLNNNFIDAYRKKYPNPVEYPGITWPSYNNSVDLSALVWTEDADDRDRIDFIYYYPDDRLHLNDMSIVGPKSSIAFGEVVSTNPGSDKFIEPQGVWPSDHKGVLARFSLRNL